MANRLFGPGMLDDFGESGFELAIDASKCLQAEDRAGSLLRATVASRVYSIWSKQFPTHHQESIVPRILRKVGCCLEQISGDEWMVYCRALRDWLSDGSETLKTL